MTCSTGAGVMAAEQVFRQLVDTRFSSERWEYTAQDCILYALGLGCTAQQPNRTYESHADFAPLPSLPSAGSVPRRQSGRRAQRLPGKLAAFYRLCMQLYKSSASCTRWAWAAPRSSPTGRTRAMQTSHHCLASQYWRSTKASNQAAVLSAFQASLLFKAFRQLCKSPASCTRWAWAAPRSSPTGRTRAMQTSHHCLACPVLAQYQGEQPGRSSLCLPGKLAFQGFQAAVQKPCILYALGLGCTAQQPNRTYERPCRLRASA